MRMLLVGFLMATHAGFAAGSLAERLHSLTDLRLSPDGKVLLFTESWPDIGADRRHSRLMRLALEGGVPSPMAGTPEGASDLVWSPDGTRIAFLAGGAIWTQQPGSQPVKVCKYDHSNAYLARSGGALVWSPDGARLAFAGTI
ncbi:MAG: hypothetical protein NTY38_13805, partial [Acidobacteria bacterium]|nr:hypothetical protein [Acidobacteriota bacterium]